MSEHSTKFSYSDLLMKKSQLLSDLLPSKGKLSELLMAKEQLVARYEELSTTPNVGDDSSGKRQSELNMLVQVIRWLDNES